MELKELLFADRSERAKLRFSGEQAAWFLDQILTQSFEDMTSGEARDTAMLTVHGRMIGYLETIATDGGILAHLEPELRTRLPEELRKYVFATRVEIEDVTDEFGLVLIAGPTWQQAARVIAQDAVLHPTRALGAEAGYVWVPRGKTEGALSALEDEGLKPAGEDELEDIRISNGAPRWGRDMNEKTIPQEAGIHEWAVHFEKGCYLGQEAMAKIHFRGKVNRKLRRLVAEGPMSPGAEVLDGDQKIGVITSASANSALAMLRHTVEGGAKVRAGTVEAEVLE
jgi:tRNA-modifying protein YgfZ